MKKLTLGIEILIFILAAFRVQGQPETDLYSKFKRLTFTEHRTDILNYNYSEASILPFTWMKTKLILPYSTSTIFSRNIEAGNYLLDFTKMNHRIRRMKYFYANAEWNWLKLSTKYKGAAWDFFIADNLYLSAGFEKPMLQFLDLGNKAFLGQSVDFSIPASIMYYRTVGLTWAKTMNPRLDVAVTGKIYSGHSFFNLKPTISIFTEANADYIEINVQGDGRLSLPLDLKSSADGYVTNLQFGLNAKDYFWVSGNPGLGADFSATYHLNPRMDIFADVIDLGAIWWRKNTNNVTLDHNFRWSGIDVSGMLNSSNGLSLNGLSNIGLRDSFLYQLAIPKTSSFVTKVPMKMVVGSNYRYSLKWEFEYYNQLQFFTYYVRELFSASAIYSWSEKLELWSGLTFQNQSYFDIPVGVIYEGNKLHLSASLNNLWGIILPRYSRNFGGSIQLRYKFNFNTDPTERKKDKDGFPFFNPYKSYDN